jgi:hypothetical protein
MVVSRPRCALHSTEPHPTFRLKENHTPMQIHTKVPPIDSKDCTRPSQSKPNKRCTKTYDEPSLADQEEVVVVRMACILVHHCACQFTISSVRIQVQKHAKPCQHNHLTHPVLCTLVLPVAYDETEVQFRSRG